MAEVKILNETPDNATIQTNQGEQVTVPKNSPLFANFMDKLKTAVNPETYVRLNPTEEQLAEVAARNAPPAMSPVPEVSPEEAVQDQAGIGADVASGTTEMQYGEPLPGSGLVTPANPDPSRPAPTGPVAPVGAVAAPMVPPVQYATETQKTTGKTTKGDTVRPEDAKAIKTATDNLETISRAQVASDAAFQDLATEQMKQEATRLKLANAADAKRERDQIQAQANWLSNIRSTIKEYEGMKVDPNRMYGNLSTGNKIASSVALFLGAFGAGASGGPNLAMDVLNKAIDRDIDAQKANIDTKKNAIDLKRGAYQDLLQLTGNADAARKAEEIRLSNVALKQLEVIKEMSKNPQAALQAEKGIEAIRLQQAEKMAELQKMSVTDATSTVVGQKPLVAAAPKPLENASKDTIDKINNYTNAIQYLRELKGVAEKNKSKMGPVKGRMSAWAATLGVEDAGQADLGQRILQSVAEKTRAISGAASTDAEAERLSKTLGRLQDNPEAFFKKLDNELAKMEREYDNVYKQQAGFANLPNKIIDTAEDRARADEKAKRTRRE
jgi:hypothetical protein